MRSYSLMLKRLLGSWIAILSSSLFLRYNYVVRTARSKQRSYGPSWNMSGESALAPLRRIAKRLPPQLAPPGSVLGGHLHPLLHGAAAHGVEQPRPGKRQRLGMCRPGQLEHHRALVEPGERLPVLVLEAWHPEHLPRRRGRRRCNLRGNRLVG